MISQFLILLLPSYLLFTPAATWDAIFTEEDSSVVCQQENDTLQYPKLPALPEMFEALIEVTDIGRNLTFDVHEYSNLEQTALHRLSDGNVTRCNYKFHDMEGCVVRGIQCNWTHDLPRNCFCYGSECLSYIPLSTIFGYLHQHGVLYVGQNTVRGIPSETWALKCWSQENATNGITLQVVFNQLGYKMPSGDSDTPLRIIIESHGQQLGFSQPVIELSYEIVQFRAGPIQDKEVFMPPPGVFCRFPKVYRPLPSLANLFSVTMETVLNEKHIISYVQHHYDALEKLVSFNVRRHRHGDVALGATFQMPDSGDRFRVIHDFESGIQYMIDERNMNCSINEIPKTSFDVALVDGVHVRLRHANELLNSETDQFVYVGERTMRGVPCDVWVAEKPLNSRGEYITVEVYFSQENWFVEVEVVNQEQMTPMGISTYIATSPSALNFSNVVHTFFFGYSIGHPDWLNFDISQCLSRSNRMFLVLTLKVSYSKLVEQGIEVIADSIRRAVAELAGVSPLRVTNIFLSNSQQPEEVDVWFILLEHPHIRGDTLSIKAIIPLVEANKILHSFIDDQDYTINLIVSSRTMSVIIKKHSLETTTEALHPNTRHQGMHVVKSGYTAGSMTGLGFSMAILGTVTGLFIGYLLWKKGSGVPYLVHD